MDIIRNQQKSEFLFNKLSQTRRGWRKYKIKKDSTIFLKISLGPLKYMYVHTFCEYLGAFIVKLLSKFPSIKRFC